MLSTTSATCKSAPQSQYPCYRSVEHLCNRCAHTHSLFAAASWPRFGQDTAVVLLFAVNESGFKHLHAMPLLSLCAQLSFPVLLVRTAVPASWPPQSTHRHLSASAAGRRAIARAAADGLTVRVAMGDGRAQLQICRALAGRWSVVLGEWSRKHGGEFAGSPCGIAVCR